MSIVTTDPHKGSSSNATRVSQACIDLIKRNEGCELKAYLDKIAKPPVWTIGFGHTGPDVHPGRVMTQKEAEDTLLDRLHNEYCPKVLEALEGTPVNQNQLDAMTSMAYNVGNGRADDPDTPENEGRGFAGSSVCRLHKEARYEEAANAFRLWNKAGGKVVRGLSLRREEERELYLNGRKVPDPATFTGPIVAIQEILVNAGLYPKNKVDGDFYTGTKKALNALLVRGGRHLPLDQIPDL